MPAQQLFRCQMVWASCIALLGASACFGERALEFPTQQGPVEVQRKPPGIAVDPVLQLPRATENASTDEQLAVLLSPDSSAVAERIVDAFFKAIAIESDRALFAVLGPDAMFTNSSRRVPARGFWLARLSRFDYAELGGHRLYDASGIEIFDRTAALALGKRRALPLPVNSGQLLVRVPLTSHALSAPRRFGDNISFVMGPNADGQWNIQALSEAFQLN